MLLRKLLTQPPRPPLKIKIINSFNFIKIFWEILTHHRRLSSWSKIFGIKKMIFYSRKNVDLPPRPPPPLRIKIDKKKSQFLKGKIQTVNTSTTPTAFYKIKLKLNVCCFIKTLLTSTTPFEICKSFVQG